MKKVLVFALVISSIFYACEPQKRETKPKNTDREMAKDDPLPSWNDGEVKASIIQFVEKTTNVDSPDYLEIEDRIATFDNDGTLWSEKPTYFQLAFAIDRIFEMSADHPEWQEEEPFRSVLNKDFENLGKQGIPAIVKIVTTTHSGMTTDEFAAIVRDWLSRSRHSRFDRLHTDLIYQPMLELLDYLRDHNYKTYIISGGGIDFLRVWTYDTYGIPTDQVFGSSIKTEFDYNDGEPVIRRLAELDFIDDKEGKPVGIHKFIGKRPVMAVGNSDGDLQMVQWTMAGDGLRFGMFVHHTDSLREYAYDRNSHEGRFDKALDIAKENNWQIVDMKKDWKVVFPFELL